MDYASFLAGKRRTHADSGLDAAPGTLHPGLFDWQRHIVAWALRKGRACMFEDCGLGKTFQQLEWARAVPGEVLIVAPLAVAHQTQREATRWGLPGEVSRDGTRRGKVTITNYGQIHKFDLATFDGVVLDESSILKSHDGKTRTAILEAVRNVPYRLACTATPAPNDHMELGNHAEFVGAMSRVEMLATFFVHDGGDTSKWRLKGHAVPEFWEWVATWAVMVRTPADIGFDGSGFKLPALTTVEHHIASGIRQEGALVALPALSMSEQRAARRSTLAARVAEVASMVNRSDEPWVVWCELNAEGDALEAAIPDAIQVAGADSDGAKAEKLAAFSDGRARVVVTKPKIAGFGLNWQHCARQAFVGLSHSWEQFYQAVRRCWRFGQQAEVEVHIVATDIEASILDNIKRKQASADDMAAQMVAHMGATMRDQIRGQDAPAVEPADVGVTHRGDGWAMELGDCVDLASALPPDSVDYTVFSPPFASLYTYSASPRDMGNCGDEETFFRHLSFLVGELFRATRPGRLMSFHCMDLPSTKQHHGVIGLRDFRGDLIRAFSSAGWVLHSQVTIWKDPVTAMQRTKALGLLWKQLKKDSCRSRQGIPDYLVTMRKPGDNPDPVSHTPEGFPVELWQRYASPVWFDINPSDTLQKRSAREQDDERHICPLQLEVVRRALKMWSNPGDLVLSPFAGIGSEGYVALQEGRRFRGFELKRSYYDQACANLGAALAQPSLFALGT